MTHEPSGQHEEELEALRSVQDRRRRELGIEPGQPRPRTVSSIVDGAAAKWAGPSAEALAREEKLVALRAADRERGVAARRRRAEERALGCIPERHRAASFDEPSFSWRRPGAVQAAKQRIESSASMITIAGTNRVGKSTLAAAMVRAIVARQAMPDAEWVTASKLVRLKQEHQLGQPFELLNRCLSAELLVLDDLGQEPDNEWKRVVIDLLHERFEDERQTIVTTWFLSAEEASARYGGGIGNRLFEADHAIRFGGAR